MPGEVQLTIQTHRPFFPATGGTQLAYVLAEIRPTGAITHVRMSLNFAFVLDHSGSMSGAKLANLKTATKLAIDHLQPDDLVSIVIFDNKMEILIPSGPARDLAALKRQVDKIRDGGGTEMSRGIRQGLAELRKGRSPQRVSRMLLLTDGETFGDADVCRKLAAEAGREGIPIIALGLGEEWNEQLLDDIAEASGGVSDFIPEGKPEVILRTFESHVRSAQAAAIQNTQFILRLIPGVLPRAVWRVTPLIAKLGHRALSDRDIQVTLGDMDVGQGQSVLVEVLLPPRAPGTYRIMQAEVNYDIISLGRTGEKAKTDVILEFTSDLARASQINPYVMNIVEKVTAHRLQTQALDEAAVGNIAGATQKLRAAATRLLELGEEELARTALEEARRLEEGKGLSSAGTKKLRYETRKLTQKLLEDEQ